MNARRIVWVLTVVVLLEAMAFGIAALIHAGAPIPVGVREPVVGSAAVIEGVVSIGLLATAVIILAQQSWARGAAFIAHAISVLGLMMAMADLALSRGDRSIANDYFYRVMLVIAMLVLVFLLTGAARGALSKRRKAA